MISNAENNKNKTEIPKRAKLTSEESRRRVIEFSKRKEEFIATIRKGKD